METIKRSLEKLAPAGDLRQSARDHYNHLVQLADKLQKIGLDELTIDQCVTGIFEQYKSQLLRNITECTPRFPI